MTVTFHLSLAVPTVEDSVAFFRDVLGGTVTHSDPGGYVNIDLFGTQLTLAPGEAVAAGAPQFHFGLNLNSSDFDSAARRIEASPLATIVSGARVVDVGTAIARRKMYVRCPAGYLIELKSYVR